MPDRILQELLITPVFVYPSPLSEKEDAALFAKPVIPFRNAASAHVFFGSERATLQASTASGRRCLFQPLPQDWVPNPGGSRHSEEQGLYAAGSPWAAPFARLQHGSRPRS